MINARAETLLEKPAYRRLVGSRRCLIIADGSYEWQLIEGRKQQIRFALAAGEPFAFAGLWTSRTDNATGEIIESATIITTRANEVVAPVHDRMPVILARDAEELWLEPDVIKQTGDGFFAAFDNPKAAIEAAVAIQRALDAEIVAPDVRIGVHTGGAFRTEADYAGQGVHVAARIAAAAGATEILVSRDSLDGGGSSLRVSEPRSELLKGFEQPIDVVSVDWR